MPEGRDPAIKLFGRNILVPDSQILSEHQEEAAKAEAEAEDSSTEKSSKQDTSSKLDKGVENNNLNPTQEDEAKTNYKLDEDQGSGSGIACQEKLLKRPDNVSPCPRCNSLDTKFCYFNNYNVSQQRHFCKNCQRHWTAGGTLRNFPVRAGRRKNKHSSSLYHQVVVPFDAAAIARAETVNCASNGNFLCAGPAASSRPVKGIGEVLKFGRDTPVCESMETVLNLKDKKISVVMGSAATGQDNGEEPSLSGSLLIATSFQENKQPEKEIEQGGLPEQYNRLTPTHPLPVYPGPPWAYACDTGWSAMVFGPYSSDKNHVQMGSPGSPPMVAVPGFCTPSIRLPYMPHSYWGCMSSWHAKKWNMPFVGSSGFPSPSSSNSNSVCSGNSLSTLGKRSRDANLQAEEKMEQCLWVPKTLRINDPNEAAKSSIWASLGIKPKKSRPIMSGGIFKAFQSKSDTSSATAYADEVLQANPAAPSRSQSFQESA